MCCSSEYLLAGSEFGPDPNNDCEGDYRNTELAYLHFRFRRISFNQEPVKGHMVCQ